MSVLFGVDTLSYSRKVSASAQFRPFSIKVSTATLSALPILKAGQRRVILTGTIG